MYAADSLASSRPDILVWETEGGAIDAPADASWPPAGRHTAMLARLGAALVGEWNNLPTPLRRAVYDRAAPADAGRSGQRARRDLARYLHDHKSRSGRG